MAIPLIAALGAASVGAGAISTINSGLQSHLDRQQDWAKHEDTMQLEYDKLNSAKYLEYEQMKKAGINLGASLGNSGASLAYNTSGKSNESDNQQQLIFANAAKKLIKRHKNEFLSILNNSGKNARQSNL